MLRPTILSSTVDKCLCLLQVLTRVPPIPYAQAVLRLGFEFLCLVVSVWFCSESNLSRAFRSFWLACFVVSHCASKGSRFIHIAQVVQKKFKSILHHSASRQQHVRVSFTTGSLSTINRSSQFYDMMQVSDDPIIVALGHFGPLRTLKRRL